MNVLSLFDGMSCGRVALERCGFKIDNYFASEIDKYAITIAANNYLDTIHIGDVTKVRGADLPQIDLLIGGSPCQGFSFAGKQLNFEDPRSKLFFEFVRLVKECKPKYFFLENVVMKAQYHNVITKYLGIDPIFLNSELVSAQSRPRMYWTNIPGYVEPKQKGLILDDIIQYDIPFSRTGTLVPGKTSKLGLIIAGEATDINNHGQHKRIYSVEGKGPTLTTSQGGYTKAKVAKLNKACIIGRRLDSNGVRKDYDKSVPITQCLEVRATNINKSNCLTTVGKDNVLTTLAPGRYPDAYKNKLPYRELTPIEYERLQTLPDNYTIGVSNSQRYKMLGNGWTVDAICEFFKHIPKDLDLF